MGALPTGALSLTQVRDHVGKSGQFNIRDRRAIWLAFLQDSKTFTGKIEMSDFRGKDYDQSWVWYGNEQLHHSRPLEQNSSYEYSEGQVISNPYVDGDWQYRWAINRVAKSSYYRQVSSHGRRRHGRYSRSRQDRWFYAFTAYKKLQRRAW